MKSLFISYTRKDENVIHRLCANFDRKGIAYWLYAKEIDRVLND